MDKKRRVPKQLVILVNIRVVLNRDYVLQRVHVENYAVPPVHLIAVNGIRGWVGIGKPLVELIYGYILNHGHILINRLVAHFIPRKRIAFVWRHNYGLGLIQFHPANSLVEALYHGAASNFESEKVEMSRPMIANGLRIRHVILRYIFNVCVENSPLAAVVDITVIAHGNLIPFLNYGDTLSTAIRIYIVLVDPHRDPQHKQE